MSFQERALSFACRENTLLGIVSLPSVPATTGIVIVVGGPQYRAGSHRQFVSLARHLARQGYAVLRFDCHGMGDSTGQLQDFQYFDEDIRCAIDCLCEQAPGLKNIVLWGLCDAASAILLYWHGQRDTRVTGMCLANPWVRSAATLASTHVKHYYAQRILEKEFWAKLLSGRVALSALTDLTQNIRLAFAKQQRAGKGSATLSFQQRMMAGWGDYSGRILLLLSELDYTAKEFLEYIKSDADSRGLLDQDNVTAHTLLNCDHTFSGRQASSQVEDLTTAWLRVLETVNPRRSP